MATQPGGIGDVKWSLLDEAQFQQINGPFWVLSRGQSIAGSQLSTLTGISVLPDTRSVFIRSLDADRGVDQEVVAVASFSLLNSQCTLATPPVGSEYALALGQRIIFSNSGTLPSPLVLGATYYVIPVASDTFNLAATFAQAVAGQIITITTPETLPLDANLQRVAGSQQTQKLQDLSSFLSDPGHDHGYLAPDPGTLVGVAAGTDFNVFSATIAATTDPSPTGITSTGTETRPSNVGFYCYVRIN